jgi:hypothetical protein
MHLFLRIVPLAWKFKAIVFHRQKKVFLDICYSFHSTNIHVREAVVATIIINFAAEQRAKKDDGKQRDRRTTTPKTFGEIIFPSVFDSILVSPTLLLTSLLSRETSSMDRKYVMERTSEYIKQKLMLARQKKISKSDEQKTVKIAKILKKSCGL